MTSLLNPCCTSIGAVETEDEEDSLKDEEGEDYTEFVKHDSLLDKSTGRTVLYATCGNPEGTTPLLLFPPLGGTRRMLLVLKHPFQQQQLSSKLFAICVSRPGSEEGSSTTDKDPTTAAQQVEAHLQDTLAVLDHLQLQQASILATCAGMSFALAFCAKHASRTTGKFLALAPWSLPADCPAQKSLFCFAAHYLHRTTISSVVGSIQMCMMNCLSKDFVAQKMRETCSAEELEYLENRFHDGDDKPQPSGNNNMVHDDAFGRELAWMMGKAHNEKMDIMVCLSSSQDLGFDYSQVKQQDIIIWQGDQDKMTTLPATQWLADQLPKARLFVVPNGTHHGALFMLGSEFNLALEHLTVLQ